MFEEAVTLNVGGKIYTTFRSTLISVPGSWLAELFEFGTNAVYDQKGLMLINRNGEIFSYILDYLRDPGPQSLPASAELRDRILKEAEFYRLTDLADEIKISKRSSPSTITLSYRGQLSSGRDSLADVQFRRIMRILVSGKSSVCREVFCETLNESRAPDCGPADDKYSSRYYLTHNNLEMAFDRLFEVGFSMVGCCGESTTGSLGQRVKPTSDVDEGKCQYFHEFYFVRM